MPTTVTNHEALQLVVAVHRLVRSLRQAAPARRLQPTQLLVLSELSTHGPMRIGEIAVRALCSQPTATTVVTSLESWIKERGAIAQQTAAMGLSHGARW